MKKNILISILVVIVALSMLGTACFCAYMTNRDTVNASVNNLLETRIKEYITSNKGEFVGPTGSTGARGEKGEAGEDGVNGQTPYIGENGNWWIGEEDTGHSVEGGSSTSKYYSNISLYFGSGTRIAMIRFPYVGSRPANELTNNDMIEYIAARAGGIISNRYYPSEGNIADINYMYFQTSWMIPATGYLGLTNACQGNVIGLGIIEAPANHFSEYELCICFVNSSGEIKYYTNQNYGFEFNKSPSEVL